MKYFLSLFLVLAVSASTLSAQTKDRGIKNDPAAQALLDKVSAKYKAYTSLEMTFTLSIQSSEDNLNENMTGSAWIKGEKYRVTTNTIEIVCDNVKRWTYLKESNEVQVNFYEPEENNIESPAQLFTLYKKNFYYRMSADDKVDGKTVKMVELIPSNLANSTYEKILLSIDPTTNTIVRAKVFNKDKVTYTWKISKFTPGAKIDDTKFVFDTSKYPKVHVEDMTK
jgi:outer membrane lipoprotein carrier protein